MTSGEEFAMPFIRRNELPPKPRRTALTEMRGPYYSAIGPRMLRDVCETMGAFVDSLKYAGGSFVLMRPDVVRELNEIAHEHGLTVSTGGFVERVLARGGDTVRRYVEAARELGFDTVEISTGFITIPGDDWLRLCDTVREAGLKPKPEIGVQFGAGGSSRSDVLQSQATSDPDWAVDMARRFVDAGVELIMIESEGVTENVDAWRTDVPAAFANAVGLERLMFEAADPEVFRWYIQTYGPEVNLFVDHSQVVELAATRTGIWGPHHLWGRVQTYKGDRAANGPVGGTR